MSDPQNRRSPQGGWAPPQPGPWGPPGAYRPGQNPPGQMPPPPPRPPARARSAPSPALILALCGIVAGAVVELSYYTSHTVNGVVADCDYTNFAPILLGPLGAAAGLWAVLTRKRRAPERQPFELGAGLFLIALGLLQALGGLGVLGGLHLSLDPSNPC